MKKIIIMLSCILLTSCTPKETETIQYSKEFSVGQLEREYLPEGMVLTSLSTNTITVTSKAQSNIDNVNCKLDFSTCEGEGVCTVYVQCDREVKVSDRVIEVGIEYLYDPFSTIPEFSNNFTDGEYHVSEEYPMLLLYNEGCADERNEGALVAPKKCEVLEEQFDDYYVVYPTNHLWPDYENATIVSYNDALKGSDRYLMDISLVPVEERSSSTKYLETSHKSKLEEAMNELEIVAFYPDYMYYYYNEENCFNRYAEIHYSENKHYITIIIQQYADPETAFVEVRSNYDIENFKMYVRTHGFFDKLDELLEGIEGNKTVEPCPVSTE